MKRLFGFVSLLLIILMTASLTSGLELSASTGGNGGSSSTHVVYGATIEDYANEHIQLNLGDGSLSNYYSGLGSLPYGSSVAQDSNGNKAPVSRSVVGKPGYTSWSYDWGTSNSNGAYAWLTNMDVKNAYSITGAAIASNKEGDSAVEQTLASSQTPTASISGYQATAYANTGSVSAKQNAKSVNGDTTVMLNGYSMNREGDSTNTYIKGSGNTQISNPSNRVTAFSNLATASESVSDAYGSSYVQMISHAVNKAPAYENNQNLNYIGVNAGTADFGIQKNKNNHLSGSLGCSADVSMVNLYPSISGISNKNTAIILEPFRSQIDVARGSDLELRNTVFNSLLNAQFAVTYYSDSAVTRDRVGQMDDNWVSVIETHGETGVLNGLMGGTSLMISRSAESNKIIKPSDMKSMFVKNNGLTIFSACDSAKYTWWGWGTNPLLNAVKDKAWVSGGYDHEVGMKADGLFLSSFFSDLTNYNLPANKRTVTAANVVANNAVSYLDPRQKLVLQPNNHDLLL
jgi:hypothetical protein